MMPRRHYQDTQTAFGRQQVRVQPEHLVLTVTPLALTRKTASKNRGFCREKSRKLTSPLGEAAQPCSGARMPHCPQDCA